MEDKNKRLMLMKELIRNEKISSQHQLLQILEGKGYHVTQATLSRDLKTLNVVKVSDPEFGYLYTINGGTGNTLGKNNPIPSPLAAFHSMEFSGNLAIIRTMPAFAPSIASMLDRMNIYGILGTVAGDDNILVVLREGIRPTDIKSALITELPELKNKL